MKIIVTYQPSVGKILREISKLEKRKTLKPEEKRKFRRLLDAYKAYEESGELYYTEEKITHVDINTFRKILTPERIKLIQALKQKEAESISALARALGRDVKNVYDDLKLLENLNFVKLEKLSKNTTIRATVEEISFEF